MSKIIRTNAANLDFQMLVRQLDNELAIIDGDDHDFYHQYNGINDIRYALVCYIKGTPVSCGAIKYFDEKSMEVKRMYTLPEYRGKGYASLVLDELEIWAKELGFSYCLMETGKRQKEAVALYSKNGYTVISNYGQYAGVENSVCFRKALANFS